MGHFFAARQRGLDVGAPTFIPFVGAWIEMKDLPHNVETEAYVGMGGPLVGTLGAMLCYVLGRAYDSDMLLALTYSGLMINLFNLLPISPMDGGRITAVISPKIWLLGVPMLVALFFYSGSPIYILIGVLAYPQIKLALFGGAGQSDYYDVPMATRVNYGLAYLGLVAFLAMMSYELHQSLAVYNSRL